MVPPPFGKCNESNDGGMEEKVYNLDNNNGGIEASGEKVVVVMGVEEWLPQKTRSSAH